MVEPMFTGEFDAAVSVGSLLELKGPEAKHAITVRRMRVGEAIQLTNKRGLRLRGQVDSILGNTLNIKVASVEQDPLPVIQLTLIQALAKGDRDELAIQAATELGLIHVIPWQADRSVSRWIGLKEDKGVERWQSIVTEAAKQSLNTWHPSVGSPVQGTGVADLADSFDLMLVLDPTAAAGLGSLSFKPGAKIALVVGPEGGISDPELAALENSGAIRVNLGVPVLRTSTAGIAAISGVLALTGQWGAK
jgi:16S rRNA (uracil1498-N3)-methyltransferase